MKPLKSNPPPTASKIEVPSSQTPKSILLRPMPMKGIQSNARVFSAATAKKTVLDSQP